MTDPASPPPAAAPDPGELLRSKSYLALLVFGALIGFGYGEGDEDAIEAGAELGAESMAEKGGHLIPEEDAWYVADAIPNGSAAAIILLEHLWAIPLRDAIVDAGGIALADEWIHASDLIAVGVAAAAE